MPDLGEGRAEPGSVLPGGDAPAWGGEHTDRAGLWLSNRLTGERFGLTADRLRAWRGGCPLLGGKRLRAQRVPVAEAKAGRRWCGPRSVWHAGDLETTAAERARLATGL